MDNLKIYQNSVYFNNKKALLYLSGKCTIYIFFFTISIIIFVISFFVICEINKATIIETERFLNYFYKHNKQLLVQKYRNLE